MYPFMCDVFNRRQNDKLSQRKKDYNMQATVNSIAYRYTYSPTSMNIQESSPMAILVPCKEYALYFREFANYRQVLLR